MQPVKRGFPKSFLTFLLFCVLLISWSGCSLWAKKEPPPKTAEVLYGDGIGFMNKKKYLRAAEAFRRLKEEFPLSPLTPLAEIRSADALYYDKNYAEAIVIYEEFKKLHPVHPEVAYATYQVGMCHFKQMLTPDRDQTVTEKALEQFRYLNDNFPQSKYVPDARAKMQVCLRRLAEHEFVVADLYYRLGNYKGALGRFEGILKTYPDSGLEKKINPLLAKCRKKAVQEEEKRKQIEEKEKNKKKKSTSS